MGIIDAIVQAYRNPSPNWRDDDVARTNFIAAAVRELVAAETEVYVKWGYGGAFNGAAWLMSQSDGADIFFYRRLPRHSTSGTIVDFSRGRAIAHVPSAYRARLVPIVAAAESRFEETWRAQGATLLSSVTRLQMWLWITSETESAADIAASQFAAPLGTLGKVKRTAVSRMPPDSWQADLDMLMHSVEQHDHVVEALSGVLPGLTGSMFGGGSTVHLPMPGSASAAWVNGVLVTARQA